MTVHSPFDTTSLPVDGPDAVSSRDRRQDNRQFHGKKLVILLPGDDSPAETPRIWAEI